MLSYVKLARPKQWTKNLVVLAGPMFGQTFSPEAALNTLIIFVAFCLVSSASYSINDLMDRKADALHPTKRTRPIASGAISPTGAIIFALLAVAGSLSLSITFLPVLCPVILVAYLVEVQAYSLALKRQVILDVILIAIGFVLRASAGAAAVNVRISPWLLVCTFTVALFLGFGKRRCELAAFHKAGGDGSKHRPVLSQYTPELINQLNSVSGGVAVVTFLLYTMTPDSGVHAPHFPKQHLLYSVPLVVYGIFRYAMVTESGKYEGPAEILLKDRPILVVAFLWFLCGVAVVTEQYWLPLLGIQL